MLETEEEKRKVVELQRDNAQQGISFSIIDNCSGPAIINVDQRRIEQVFDNLINNTIRYTDTPGRCQLTLSKNKNGFCIKYEDSSPGVGDESLGRLFERLYREDKSRNRALGGSGLGLSIVDAFITAHKGTIKASHSELGGVCFDICLPTEKLSNENSGQ